MFCLGRFWTVHKHYFYSFHFTQCLKFERKCSFVLFSLCISKSFTLNAKPFMKFNIDTY
jgi:hypothetical protein